MTDDNDQAKWFSGGFPADGLADLVAHRDDLVRTLRETADPDQRSELAARLRNVSEQLDGELVRAADDPEIAPGSQSHAGHDPGFQKHLEPESLPDDQSFPDSHEQRQVPEPNEPTPDPQEQREHTGQQRQPTIYQPTTPDSVRALRADDPSLDEPLFHRVFSDRPVEPESSAAEDRGRETVTFDAATPDIGPAGGQEAPPRAAETGELHEAELASWPNPLDQTTPPPPTAPSNGA